MFSSMGIQFPDKKGTIPLLSIFTPLFAGAVAIDFMSRKDPLYSLEMIDFFGVLLQYDRPFQSVPEIT